MAYRFRLDPLLTLRRRQAELAENELAKRVKRCAELREALQSATEQRDAAKARLEQDLSSGLLAGEYLLRVTHFERLVQLEARLQKDLAGAEAALQQARQRYAERHRDQELVERLRQRDYDLYRAEELKEAQKQTDDLTTVRYVRERH